MTAAERQRRHRGVNLEASPAPMSKSEREDLQRLVRHREKVLKTAASQRSAELIADFEQQLASIYSYVRMTSGGRPTIPPRRKSPRPAR
jgi:hypothetical protein